MKGGSDVTPAPHRHHYRFLRHLTGDDESGPSDVLFCTRCGETKAILDIPEDPFLHSHTWVWLRRDLAAPSYPAGTLAFQDPCGAYDLFFCNECLQYQRVAAE